MGFFRWKICFFDDQYKKFFLCAENQGFLISYPRLVYENKEILGIQLFVRL